MPPTDTIGASLGHARLAGAANGVSLSTSAAFVGLIKGTQYVELIPRNFSTAVVMRYIECPYLIVLKTLNSLTTAPINYSDVAQDGSTATSVVLSEMEAPGTGGYLYVGCPVKFRGVNIDVDGTNGVGTSVLTVRYFNGAWTDISDTDGTESTSSLRQDGSVTWTVPATWRACTLVEAGDTILHFPYADDKYYWTRWEWSAAFTDTSVTLDHMLGINESTTYAERATGNILAARVHHGVGVTGISGFEMLTDAGTANCLVNCYTLSGRFTEGATS